MKRGCSCLYPSVALQASECCTIVLSQCLTGASALQSEISQNGSSSSAQIESNGKAAHSAVLQAVTAEGREASYGSNGAAVLQNGSAAASTNGSSTVEELKDAATILSVTENGAIGADSEQNGAWDPAWADPCEVGHLEACAADR